jgi:hypothetical protein
MPKGGSATAVAGSGSARHFLLRLGAFLLLTVAGTVLLALPYA